MKEMITLYIGVTMIVASVFILIRWKVKSNSMRLSSPKKAATMFYQKLKMPFMGKFQVVLVEKLDLIAIMDCGVVPNYFIALFCGDTDNADKLAAARTEEEQIQDLKDFRELKVGIAEKSLVKPSYKDYLDARTKLDPRFKGCPLDDKALDSLFLYQIEKIAPLLKKNGL